MYEKQDDHDIQNPIPMGESRPVEATRIKVYERPANHPIPIWVWMTVLMIGLLMVWFVFQAWR